MIIQVKRDFNMAVEKCMRGPTALYTHQKGQSEQSFKYVTALVAKVDFY